MACSGKHPSRAETTPDEVTGPIASFTADHTYEGRYPDGCRATDSYRYSLYVDGEHVASAGDGSPKEGLLRSIAVRLNLGASPCGPESEPLL